MCDMYPANDAPDFRPFRFIDTAVKASASISVVDRVAALANILRSGLGRVEAVGVRLEIAVA